MGKTSTATVEMDEKGRVTIPKPVRKDLGVNGDTAIVSLQIEVKRKDDD